MAQKIVGQADAPSAGSPGARAPYTPESLLKALDGWLAEAGHGDDDRWRVSIAQTLAAHPRPADAHLAFDVVCSAIARSALGALELIDDQVNVPHCVPLRAAVAQMGWLADDCVSRLCGGAYIHGDAAAWILHDFEAEALQTEGGAA